MGFRFHKRIKILPGLYWNVGGKRSSWSVKIGGVTKNFSSRGTRTTLNLRGTGVSYTTFKPRRAQGALPPPAPGRRQSVGVVGVVGRVLLFAFSGALILSCGLAIFKNATNSSQQNYSTTSAGEPLAMVHESPRVASLPAPSDGAPNSLMPGVSKFSPLQPALTELPSAPAPSLSDARYIGTTSTNFRKNWVELDGQILQGITSVAPVPDGKVAIIYSDGGRDVPVSSLPQGFLDQWRITAEALKRADGQ